jgi:hypothetical protein
MLSNYSDKTVTTNMADLAEQVTGTNSSQLVSAYHTHTQNMTPGSGSELTHLLYINLSLTSRIASWFCNIFAY